MIAFEHGVVHWHNGLYEGVETSLKSRTLCVEILFEILLELEFQPYNYHVRALANHVSARPRQVPILYWYGRASF